MISIAKKTEIVSLLKKYSIILILFQIFSQFALGLVPLIFSNIFTSEEMAWTQIAYGFSRVVLNLVVGLVILSDMDRNVRLTWIIFIVALFIPWAAAVFLIITRVVDVKGDVNADANNVDENILDYKLSTRND